MTSAGARPIAVAAGPGRPAVLRVASLLLALALSLVLARSAGAASLYIPNYGTGSPETISGYSLAADGTPSSLAGSPFSVGPAGTSPGGIFGLGFTPDGAHAVTGFLFEGGVLALAAADDGSLTQAQAPITTASVTAVAVSPDGRFAYATTRQSGTQGEGILGYAIGPSGELTALGGTTIGGEGYDLAITPDGRWLFANDGSSIDRFAIGAVDGKLGDEVKNVGSGQILQVSANGRFLFAGTYDSLRSYAIGADGSLTPVGSPLGDSGAFFGDFAVAADGHHLYLPDFNGNAIDTVAIASDGSLGMVEATSVTSPTAVAATPDGRFLYIEAAGEVRVAAIGADGVPTPLPGGASWASGETEPITFRPGPAPTAAFSPRAATAGSATTFDATGSQGAARYEWSFGDGTTLAEGGPTPSHTYASPGVYPVKLTVYDALGCSGTQVYTGQSTICPAGDRSSATAMVDVPAVKVDVPAAPVAASATAPVGATISSLAISRKSFPVRGARGSKQKLGTTFLYGLSEPASVTFTIERRVAGRFVAGHCKANAKADGGRRGCVLFRSEGSLDAVGVAGGNSLPFDGRVDGRLLAPGGYRVTAVATDRSGARSAPRSVSFSVERPATSRPKHP